MCWPGREGAAILRRPGIRAGTGTVWVHRAWQIALDHPFRPPSLRRRLHPDPVRAVAAAGLPAVAAAAAVAADGSLSPIPDLMASAGISVSLQQGSG